MPNTYSPDALSFSPAEVAQLGATDATSAPVDEVVQVIRTASRWEAEARMRRIQTYNRLCEIGDGAMTHLATRGEAGLAALQALATEGDPGLSSSAIWSLVRSGHEDVAEACASALAQTGAADDRRAAKATEILADWRNRPWRDEPPGAERGEAGATRPITDYGPPAIVTIEEIEAVAEELGVAHITPAAMMLMRRSLMAVPTMTQVDALPLGASRFGGMPDLPADVPWPRYATAPLSFLAQIRLQDVHDVMPEAAVPATGWLLAFFDVDASMNDDDPRRSRVIHVPGDAELSRRTFPDDLYAALRFGTCQVAFISDMTAPDTFEEPAAGDAEVRAALSFEDADAITDVFTEIVGARESRPLHRMFGYPQCWQNPVLAQAGQDPDDSVLLLQLDTDERMTGPGNDGFFWGSGGRLYFVMMKADLAVGAFDKVEAGLQYT